ncbi:MAG: hypothetical protein GMKNLPBB_00683 [Myxococcota bacterium]|nr:hypothetical protein [Myxococcota bacterium]
MNLFDVVVAGNALPALTAAALMARQGAKVLRLVPPALPPDDDWIPEPGPVSAAVLRDLGLSMMFETMARRPLHHQFVAPGFRAARVFDPGEQRLEYQREGVAPDEAGQFIARVFEAERMLLDRMAGFPGLFDEGFFATGRARRFAGSSLLTVPPPQTPGWTPAAGAFMTAAARFSGVAGSCADNPSRVSALAQAHRNRVAPAEKGDPYAAALARYLEKQGAKVMANMVPASFVIKGGALEQMRWREGSTGFAGRTFLWGSPTARLPACLPEGRSSRAYAARVQSAPAAASIIRFPLTLDARRRLPGLRERVIIAGDPARPLEGANLIQLTLRERGEVEDRWIGEMMVPGAAAPSGEDLAALIHRAWTAMNGLFFFLKEIALPPTPLDKRYLELVTTQTCHGPIPDSPLPFPGQSPITPLRNLWLANEDILPSFGIEGAFLAGGVIARRLSRDLARAPGKSPRIPG